MILLEIMRVVISLFAKHIFKYLLLNLKEFKTLCLHLTTINDIVEYPPPPHHEVDMISYRKRALYSFKQSRCMERNVQRWFFHIMFI
jgi:hypothetical protein